MVEAFGLPARYQPWDEEKIFQAMTHDKKVRGDKIRIVIVEDIGKSRIMSVPLNELREYVTLE
ncbi:hypothetical protein NRIC_34270 [Enterococcus florum]|uniref:3-dehydroquinate synthase domain-containing protein n=1 Tax=Enterococcus florum TaxID=2480627 RepID=A0A4P5PCI0_9ENTE|nr:hypothetical protein NRIC_34270 [Enterococcus florum]